MGFDEDQVRLQHAARIIGFSRQGGQLHLQPALGQCRAMMWLSSHRRDAGRAHGFGPHDVFPRDHPHVFTTALRSVTNALALLAREVWVDQAGSVVLPTDLGGKDRWKAAMRPKGGGQGGKDKGGKPFKGGRGGKGGPAPLFLIQYKLVGLPWEDAAATDLGAADAAHRQPDRPLPGGIMKGLVRAFMHRHFGSEFFCLALLSQGVSLLQPDRLAAWDKSLASQREHSAAMHPRSVTDLGTAPQRGLAAHRRALSDRLVLLRQEMQHRKLLDPIQCQVFWSQDTWYCRHHAATDHAKCRVCGIYNCPECQGLGSDLCRSSGMRCQERGAAFRAGDLARRAAEMDAKDRLGAMERCRRRVLPMAEEIADMRTRELVDAYQALASRWDESTQATVLSYRSRGLVLTPATALGAGAARGLVLSYRSRGCCSYFHL